MTVLVCSGNSHKADVAPCFCTPLLEPVANTQHDDSAQTSGAEKNVRLLRLWIYDFFRSSRITNGFFSASSGLLFGYSRCFFFRYPRVHRPENLEHTAFRSSNDRRNEHFPTQYTQRVFFYICCFPVNARDA